MSYEVRTYLAYGIEVHLPETMKWYDAPDLVTDDRYELLIFSDQSYESNRVFFLARKEDIICVTDGKVNHLTDNYFNFATQPPKNIPYAEAFNLASDCGFTAHYILPNWALGIMAG
jgi:hypothetical protein